MQSADPRFAIRTVLLDRGGMDVSKSRKFSLSRLPAGELLTCSFFLCISPVFLNWFGLGSPPGYPPVAGWVGLSVLGPLFYLSLPLCFWAAWGRRGRRLVPGILAHVLLGISYTMGFYHFAVAAGLDKKANLDVSWQAVQPAFWLSAAALALHFLFFFALEIRDGKADGNRETPER